MAIQLTLLADNITADIDKVDFVGIGVFHLVITIIQSQFTQVVILPIFADTTLWLLPWRTC